MSGVAVKFLDSNFGFSVANNRAISESETDYVVLLNPDPPPQKRVLPDLPG